MFPATTAAAALASFGDRFGDAEFLATTFEDTVLLTVPGSAMPELCVLAGDEAGVVALENLLIPDIEDFCCDCGVVIVCGFGILCAGC